MTADVTPAGYVSPLATEAQAEVERQALRLIDCPEVRVARAEARALMAAHPVAATVDGLARLDHALDAWLAYLAIQEATSDPANPQVIWSTNLTTYEWFGHEFKGSGAAIDNPDVVYRQSVIDGRSDYEIIGQLRPLHPGNFSFQLAPFVPGLCFVPAKKNSSDIETMGMLSTPNIAIAADGSFRITIGPSAPDGRPNHLQTPPESLRLIIRDVLTDWKQNPNILAIRRTAGPQLPPPPDEAELARSTAAHLPNFVAVWLAMIDNYLGRPADNVLVPPWGRVGGWGYGATVRFKLRDDQAIVITVSDGHAEYLGIQTTDPWLIAPDPQRLVASYTAGQSRRNADGTLTYVLTPRDPGTANWLDTGGFHEGWMMVRWQGLPPGTVSGSDLVRGFDVVETSALAGLLSSEMLGVTPGRRDAERVHRAAEWRLRVATG